MNQNTERAPCELASAKTPVKTSFLIKVDGLFLSVPLARGGILSERECDLAHYHSFGKGEILRWVPPPIGLVKTAEIDPKREFRR
jgi:hypothetical protein